MNMQSQGLLKTLVSIIIFSVIGCNAWGGPSHNEHWTFELTPYLWAVGFDGQIGSGSNLGDVGPGDPFFTFDNLDSAFFLKGETRKGKLIFRGEHISAKYSDSYSRLLTDTDVDFEGEISDLGVGYCLSDNCEWRAATGLRYFDITSSVRITPGGDVSRAESWVDPYIGLSYSKDISDHWTLLARADVGGFGYSAEQMVHAEAELSYSVNESVSAFLGYKYLQADYSRRLFTYDLALYGATFGMSFTF